MITTRDLVRLGGRERPTTTTSCVKCGECQTFLDLRAADAVDHRCGWRGTGGTWWVLKAARAGVR